jgi:cation transporter-like permease
LKFFSLTAFFLFYEFARLVSGTSHMGEITENPHIESNEMKTTVNKVILICFIILLCFMVSANVMAKEDQSNPVCVINTSMGDIRNTIIDSSGTS